MVTDLSLLDDSDLFANGGPSIRYFTLAHGIAHNQAKLHDWEHELRFSLICQHFLPGLSELAFA